MAKLNREITRSQLFATHYANDVQVQTSPWDVRLLFSVIQEIDVETSTLKADMVADIRVSLQLAKRFAQILQAQVETYEKSYGPIPEAPSASVDSDNIEIR